MIILSLLVLVLCMGAASAADVSDGPVMTNDNGDVSIGTSEITGGAGILGAPSKSNDVLGAGTGTFINLNETINSLGDNQTVTLDSDYTYDNDTDYAFVNGIVINQNNFTVDGNGVTIDGNSLARIFIINGNNVTLKNINFINGNATDNGGAILWNGNNATIEDANFSGNVAYGNGAAVCFVGEDMSLTEVTFGKNKAGAGLTVNVYSTDDIVARVIGYNSYFNAIYTAGMGTLKYNNVNYWDGKEETMGSSNVEIEAGKTTVVPDVVVHLGITDENSVIILDFRNITDDEGYAYFNLSDYYSEGKLNLANRFEGNDYYFQTEQPPISYSEGGDFQILQNLINTNVKQGNNYIVLDRDYTYTIGVDAIYSIRIAWDNITIDGNGHTIDAQGRGGFSVSSNNTTFKNINFINCSQTNGGAIVFWKDGLLSNDVDYYTFTVLDCNFTNCHANGRGGAVAAYCEIKIKNCNFINNTAGNEGGDLSIRYNHISSPYQSIVENCNFTNAVANGDGSIHIAQYNVTIKDCIITNSTAINNRGTISVYAVGSKIIGCTFINNTGINGVIQYRSGGRNFVLSDCNFINNKNRYGVVYINSLVDISGCTFDSNTVYEGVIYIHNNYVNIDKCIFNNNTAETSGGAISAGYRYINISNSIFTNNHAENNGGAIYSRSSRDHTYSNLTFINNSAVNGGAVYITGSYLTIFENISFVNNSADNGGSVWTSKSGENKFSNSNFTNNTATDFGSAIYRDGTGKITLINVNLTHNRAGSVMDVKEDGDILNGHLIGNNGYLNSIYSITSAVLSYNNIQYWNETQGYVTTPASDIQVTTVAGKTTDLANQPVVISSTIAEPEDKVTDDNGDVSYTATSKDNVKYTFYFDGNDCYLPSDNAGNAIGYGDFYILQKYIDDQIANGFTNIVLPRNYTYTINLDTVKDGVNISVDNVIIDGNGVTLDAQGMSRIFNILGANVTVKNINFVNGYNAVNGSAVYWNGVNGTLSGSEFINSSATNGGAVYWNGVNGTLSGSEFINSSATNGGAVYIVNNGTISNSKFENNTVASASGIIHISGANNYIINCNFNDNVTYTIYNVDSVNLTKNTLTNLIYNSGVITSPTNVTILENSTIYGSLNETVKITAIIYDDNNNIIQVNGFKFVLEDGTEIATVFDKETGIYTASYVFDTAGTYTINATTDKLSDCTLLMGTVIVTTSTPISVSVEDINYTETANVNITVGELYFNVPKDGEVIVTIIGDNNFTANYTISLSDFTQLVYTSPVFDAHGNNITVPMGVNYVLPVSGLNATDYQVFVDFSGNSQSGPNSTNTTFKVNKIDPEIIIDVENITYGENATVNVTLPATATGNITVRIAGKYYNLTDEISGLNAGDYDVIVVYDGDNNYNARTVYNTFTVSPVNSTLTVVAEPIFEGEIAVINVTLVDGEGNNMDAIVIVNVNGTDYTALVKDGNGSAIISGLTEGEYNVTAVFTGDGNYVNSTDNTSFTVTAKTNISINVSDVEIVVGENATVNVNVTDVINGQNITITVNGKKEEVTVSDGKASAEFSDLAAGQYNITVVYAGDESNAPASNTTAVVTVSKINPVANAEDLAFTVGEEGILEITGSRNVTLIVDINGAQYYAALDDTGKASLNVSSLAKGNYTVVITSVEDDMYNKVDLGAVAVINVTAKEILPTPISVDDVVIDAGETAVVNVNAPAIVGQNVTITIVGNDTKTSIVGVNGNASAEFAGLAPGEYAIVVSYAGNETQAANTTTATLTVNKKAPVVNAEDVTFTVGNDGVLEITGPANGNLIVSINGTNYAVALDATGNATLDVSGLGEGTYPVDITYIADDYYESADFTGAATVTVNAKEESGITVTVNDDNITVDAGSVDPKDINVTIDGKPAVMVDGVIDISDLAPGNHTVEVSYPGDDKYAPFENSTVISVPLVDDYEISATGAEV
ncbi:MAG: Ig-like domain repeat protein, partial [Methanobrevibacter sp.]|uniref:beta strand repeat-containing protein n=1 Tax=Methanobrevibacter sp. TaxID=66852 RepID=UPI0025E0952B